MAKTKINSCKVGIDFHGVINTSPDFFREFSAVALARRIEVHVISGGPRDSVQKYLAEHRIPYTSLWCIYDHYNEKGEVTSFEDGTFHIKDELWNAAKAEYCRKKGICIHIDDSQIYELHFSTPYCLYNHRQHVCRFGDRVLDFSQNPRQALSDLLRLIKQTK